MKKTKRSNLFRVSVFLLVMTTATAIWGCGEQDFMKRSPSDDNAQDKSVVQTEWKSEDSQDMPIENKLHGKRSSVSNPLAIEDTTVLSTQDRYLVQIGAFLNRNNAERLVERLKKKGTPASFTVSENNVKQWHIVRIGAFQDKKKALEVARRYSSTENAESAVLLNGKVVKLFKSDEEISPMRMGSRQMKRSAKNDRFTFQVGGLMTRAAAKKQNSNLSKQGYSPYIFKVADSINQETWYTVRMGRFYTIDEAADAAAKFAGEEDIPTKALLITK